MGWRVGYIAYATPPGRIDVLGPAFLKCQDTVCICAAQVSQYLALAALRTGQAYKKQMIATLAHNRELLLAALEPLGTLGNGIMGGEGAIYFWARLPPGCEDDMRAVEWITHKHGVCMVPGSACLVPGWIRVAFGNLAPDKMPEACRRLREGLQQLKILGAIPA
mmetsp:Transcript_11719/g.20849  ORF Transcript_11719/g.20849 Transcript_11719/m.20849 type:complete len:164 (+) Transcript_11719:3-494(+)